MKQLPSRYGELDAQMPRRQSASDFVAAPLPERRTLLDPILSSDSLALLYGRRGLGKSFLALGIAWAAASGTSFLGWRAGRPHRVLYIDGEMAAADLKQRLLQLGAVPPTLDIMQADSGTLPDLGYFSGLLRLVANWGHPELVVLDNLSSLVGLDKGDHDCWADLQRFLIKQRQFGRAMLLVHHANKNGDQRGTSRREDVLDLVLALRHPVDYRPKDGARFEIHFEKARGLHGEATEPIEARLRTDPQGLARWTWQPAQGNELERAAALLAKGLTAGRVAQLLGLPRATAYRLRERALARGLVTPRHTDEASS